MTSRSYDQGSKAAIMPKASCCKRQAGQERVYDLTTRPWWSAQTVLNILMVSIPFRCSRAVERPLPATEGRSLQSDNTF